MIRQFRPDDAATCSRLIRECLARDSSVSTSLAAKLRAAETPQNSEERARLFYVAVYESADQIHGLAGLDMNEIRLLCVSPQSWRRGIGRSLLDHLISMVPAILFPDIFVYSSIAGREFYKACGFQEKGPVNFEFEGEQLQTIFMSRPLK